MAIVVDPLVGRDVVWRNGGSEVIRRHIGVQIPQRLGARPVTSPSALESRYHLNASGVVDLYLIGALKRAPDLDRLPVWASVVKRGWVTRGERLGLFGGDEGDVGGNALEESAGEDGCVIL